MILARKARFSPADFALAVGPIAFRRKQPAGKGFSLDASCRSVAMSITAEAVSYTKQKRCAVEAVFSVRRLRGKSHLAHRFP